MTNEERYRRILANHLPAAAVDWVYNYLNLHKVHFHITRERRTKLGDYRHPYSSPKLGEVPEGRRSVSHPFHEISVNGDLNPYLFLWVFLHEAAHLETHVKYSSPSPTPHSPLPSPHGHEWQEEYRRLLVANSHLFPSEVQPLLKKYTRRIPLSHPVGKKIEETLHHYDPDYDPSSPTLHLDDLQSGARFSLKAKPDMRFQAEERRRTRWLCRNLDNGRQYLVNSSAEVIPC